MTVAATVDGETVTVPAGCSVAAAIIRSGRSGWRRTRRLERWRGLSCGIGACFDCLVTVNGTPGVRACLIDVREGDVIDVEHGSGFADGEV